MSLPTPYFKDDTVTIYHADCRLILPFLGPVDLLLTDPPFGIGFAAQPTTGGRKRGQVAESWDDEAPAPWLLDMARSLARDQVICGGNYFPLPTSRGWLSWFKPDAPPSMGNFELAWTNKDRITRQISQSIAATNPERLGHPTQKPLAVMSWCLEQFPETRTVLDCFAGTGTTGRAAKDRGLQCILVERDERYCELAANRMAQQVLNLGAA